ncbi:hypothetical protein ACCT30_47880, partial [Rhizobium ruizarguesonis]
MPDAKTIGENSPALLRLGSGVCVKGSILSAKRIVTGSHRTSMSPLLNFEKYALVQSSSGRNKNARTEQY